MMEVSKGVAGAIASASKEVNPANAPERRVTSANRIPMSLPQPKLAVPDIPGVHLHWFRGDNISRAQRAGYNFVDAEEVELIQHGVANAWDESGSSDMGTRISIPSGGVTEGGQYERLYLMKIPLEWWEADQAALADVNENVARAIRSGEGGTTSNPYEQGDDSKRKFLKQGQDLFYPKKPKG